MHLPSCNCLSLCARWSTEFANASRLTLTGQVVRCTTLACRNVASLIKLTASMIYCENVLGLRLLLAFTSADMSQRAAR